MELVLSLPAFQRTVQTAAQQGRERSRSPDTKPGPAHLPSPCTASLMASLKLFFPGMYGAHVAVQIPLRQIHFSHCMDSKQWL